MHDHSPYDRLDAVRGTREPLPSIAPLRDAIEQVISYRHRFLDVNDASLPPLEAALEREFFEKVYIPRPETAQIESGLTQSRLTIVHGEPGCGKSTTLQVIVRNMQGGSPFNAASLDPTKATVSAFYIDMEDNRHRLAERRRNRPTPTVCDLIYEQLSRIYSRNGQTAVDAWSHYLSDVAEAGAFAPIRELLDRYQAPPRSWSETWRLVNALGQSGLYQTCLEDFENQDGAVKLRYFLEYVQRAHAHRFVLVVDNVDQFLDSAQRQVLRKLHDLCRHKIVASALVAVRTTNLNAVLRQLGDAPALTRGLSKVHLGTHTNASFLSQFLDARLQFLFDHFDDALVEVDDHRVQEEMHADWQVVLRATNNFIRGFTGPAAENSPARLLSRWNNSSLRSTAYDLMLMVDDFLSNRDIIYPYAAVLSRPLLGSGENAHNLGRRVGRNRRFVESMAYRHILLGNSGGIAHEPAQSLFTNSPHGHSDNMRFFRAHIIQLLFKREGGMGFADLLHEFQPFGITSAHLTTALEQLNGPRGSDGKARLVRVNNRGAWGPKSTVELLESGRLLYEEVSISCEYLCWSLLLSPTGDSCLPQPDRQSNLANDKFADKVASDAYRVQLAWIFLQRRIVEGFTRAAFGRAHDPLLRSERVQAYNRAFGPELWPARCCHGLWAFASTADLEHTERMEWFKKLEGLRQSIVQTFKNANLGGRVIDEPLHPPAPPSTAR